MITSTCTFFTCFITLKHNDISHSTKCVHAQIANGGMEGNISAKTDLMERPQLHALNSKST